MALRQSGLHRVGRRLVADALHRGDVGPVARAEQDGARGDRPVEKLLLSWIPGGHDHAAGSSATKGAIVLRPFEPNHRSLMKDTNVSKGSALLVSTALPEHLSSAIKELRNSYR